MPPSRVFLLSPARTDGRRAQQLLRDGADFPTARALRTRPGVPIGEVFAQLSGLYFRGKLAYARAFAAPGCAHVITAGRGLWPIEGPLTLRDLRYMAEIGIDADESRYRRPLLRDVLALAPDVDVVLLGSIASSKYVEVLLDLLGERLVFPPAFVGRGDMSRGGLMLRCARSGEELDYAPIAGAALHGRRPPKLPRLRV